MSLLSVVRRANVLVGQRRPNSAASALDATSTAQMTEMARIEAESLANRHDWSGTLMSQQFTSNGSLNQFGALPDDFSRFPFAGGVYGPNGRMAGPLDKTQWGQMTSYPHGGLGSLGGFRLSGGGMQIYPTPAAGQAYRFDYITKAIYQAADGTPKTEWELDTDTCIIPENLIALGVIWRWLQFKGLDYGEAMRNAELEFEKLAGTDGGGRGNAAFGSSRRFDVGVAYPWPLGPNT